MAEIRDLIKRLDHIENLKEDVAGDAAEVGAKAIGKHLPGVGLVFGGADAAYRVYNGDYLGAGISLLSGIVSLEPGLGTAASIALDAANIARDHLAVAENTPNIVADPEAAKEVASAPTPPSDKDIATIVGDNLSPEAISKLAAAAEQYALPAAAIVALLYGGKVLYDYLTAKTKEKISPKTSIREMMEIVRAEQIIREML